MSFKAINENTYVCDDGQCVESGTHDELMQSGGLYRQLFDEYSRSINWKVGA